MLAGALPEAALNANHDCVFVAVQVRLPGPLLPMAIVRGAGFDPPAVLVKVNVLGATRRADAVGVVIVRLTAIVFGEDVAAFEGLTVTVSLYVPAARPAVATLRIKAPGAVPADALSESHD